MFKTLLSLITIGLLVGTLSGILFWFIILIVVLALLGLSILAARHVGPQR